MGLCEPRLGVKDAYVNAQNTFNRKTKFVTEIEVSFEYGVTVGKELRNLTLFSLVVSFCGRYLIPIVKEKGCRRHLSINVSSIFSSSSFGK